MRFIYTLGLALVMTVALLGCGDDGSSTSVTCGSGTHLENGECVADAPDGSNASDKTDVTGNGGGTDTKIADRSILFRAIVTDGYTNKRIKGGEFCVLEPKQSGENCATTDADGMATWRWLSPSKSNFTSQFKHQGYTTMLYLGRWDDQVAAFYKPELNTTGMISNNFIAFTTPIMNGWLGTGAITPKKGAGHIFVRVTGSGAGIAVDGITASLSDSSGTVVYWGSDGQTLNSKLTASSATGHFIIANVAPGTYTLNIKHDTLSCDNGFTWLVETPNQHKVPVQADTVTRAAVICSTK
jgi:hypothetical protein